MIFRQIYPFLIENILTNAINT